jgi:hypothetical protein
MNDEHFDRDYQAGRADFHRGIDRLVDRLAGAVLRLIRSARRPVEPHHGHDAADCC